VSDPASPSYRHYLRRGEFGAAFGASAGSIAAVEAWLRAQGITALSVAADRLSIEYRSTVAAVSPAFGVQLHRFRLRGGAQVVAPTAAPSVPAELRDEIAGITGLSEWTAVHPEITLPTPAAGPGAARAATPKPGAVGAVGAAITGPQPCAGAGSGGGYTAAQLAGAYGFSPLYGQGRLGAGTTVALYELEPFTAASGDVAQFQACMGTTAGVVSVPVDGGGSCTANAPCGLETALDVEQVVGLAPQSTVEVYQGPLTSGGELDAYRRIANDDAAQVVSTSWGICEAAEPSATLQAENTVFAQMALQGQSVFAASGDSGSEDCYFSIPGDTNLAVDDPSSQAHVTGVGGTSLNTSSGTEVVWNNCQGQPEAGCAALGTGGSGGGGASAIWSRPGYQSGSGARLVPDVAGSADPLHGAAVFYSGHWTSVGGTSGAAPLWGALVALADQGCFAAPWGSASSHGTVVGEVNPKLYPAATSSGATLFHDVVAGNNDYTDSHLGLDYPAGSGFDEASGWGSPVASALAGALQPAGGCPAVTGVSPARGTVGSTVTITGSGLAGATKVLFGTDAATIVSSGSGSITVRVPSSCAVGPVDVTVVTANGTSAVVPYDRFTYPSLTVATQTSGNGLTAYTTGSCGRWQGPVVVGGPGSTFSSPSMAYSPSSGEPVLAVEGPNHTLWVYWETPAGQWQGPLGVGGAGSTNSQPAIVIGSTGLPIVLVQGPQGALWAYWETAGGQWQGPYGVGGAGSSNAAPAVALGSSGLPVVTTTGPGNSLWVFWDTPGGQWQGPYGVGGAGSTNAAPAMTAGSTGLPVVSTMGPANSLWVFWETPGGLWQGPYGVGGTGSTKAAPALAGGTTGLPVAAVEGPGGSFWNYWETPGGLWDGPLGVGGPGSTVSSPSAASGG
jgi:hypothetical protein